MLNVSLPHQLRACISHKINNDSSYIKSVRERSQTRLIISIGINAINITINKARLQLVACNSPTLSAPQRTCIMEEIRIASVYFRASRLLRASAISSRASYFASREVARLHNVTTISPVFCARRHFSLFIFILPSLCIPFTVALRSHLCHPCIVFTSHAAYIILTSVARGNVRHFSVFLPNFYVFFTYSSRNLPRENSHAMQFE